VRREPFIHCGTRRSQAEAFGREFARIEALYEPCRRVSLGFPSNPRVLPFAWRAMVAALCALPWAHSRTAWSVSDGSAPHDWVLWDWWHPPKGHR
jgi:hypothetical protein